MKKIFIISIAFSPVFLTAQATKKDSTIIEEVVISAVLGHSKAKQTPFAIKSIGSKVIERSSEGNMMDILARATPGLNVVKSGPNVSKPFIRGLGYNRVLSLYDGLRQEGQQWGDEHGIEVDQYAVQRAEVIKGPASLIYGSDALAGVVAMFPVAGPKQAGPWQGRYISEFQHNNLLFGHGLQLQKRSKNLFFTFNASQRMASNYRNAIDGWVYNTNFNEKNIGTSLTYFSGDNFAKLAFTFYQNLQAIPDGSRQPLGRAFTKQISEAEQDVMANRPAVTQAELSGYQMPVLHQNIRHLRLYNNNHYVSDLGDFDLNLAWQRNHRQEFNHPTLPHLAGVNLALNTFNYSLKFQSIKYQDFRTSFGANGMLQDNKNLSATDFPIPNYQLIDGGVYAYQQWQTEGLGISAGLRYDMRQVFWQDFYVGKNAQHGFDEQQAKADSNTLQFAKANLDFSGLSASLGATYQWHLFNFKTNIGRSYRAPSLTELASNGLDPGAHMVYLGNQNFKPEFSTQMDLGAAYQTKIWGLDLALFHNHIQNYISLKQSSQSNGEPLVDAQGNKTFQYQQSSARLYGFELAFNYQAPFLEALSLEASSSMVLGKNLDETYKNQKEQGEYLPFLPPWQAYAKVVYQFKPKHGFCSEFGPSFSYDYSAKQDRFLALNDTETGSQAAHLLNADVYAKLKFGGFLSLKCSVFVNNLLNHSYQSHLNRLKYLDSNPRQAQQPFGIYNMGRNLGLKLIFEF